MTVNSLGSGWFRFRDWFVFALGWMDGWSAGGSRLVCLAGLVWSGLIWLAVLSSVGGVVTRSVLSVRLFVSYCVPYTVYSTRSVLSLRAFDVNLRWETLNYLLAVLIDNS